ncbi:hypothetical protein QA645_15855 [Bradyrhizobium sp. CIAT3101]|uniref:hypothetical protein n=1 Tax=Bradyrhizobium sp. CIAT3101 TaxID=439387 RepID=UPI0024B20403|nr:hypothetical protein [Bradyrhizobium sp. CIAT3101]WFU84155.1 hypothetical protein QA645_15855 [Bradyrhizobium sp. CIAT3101]
MSKAMHRTLVDPPLLTVGDLIDELCRLPDTAVVHFRCPALDQELTFHHLRRQSKNIVEIAVNAYPQSPPVVPSADAAFHARKQSPPSPSLREDTLLRKAKG